MREMRQSARLGRTPWVLFAITLTISLLMCSIGGIAAATDASPANIGGALFQVFFSLAFFVVVVIGPAIAANGIASEREGRTWEAVLLTGLSPKTIARGKFLAAYTSISLYIIVLAPVGALSFLFGGVTATEVLIAFVYLFFFAGLSVAFGLAVSSLLSSMRMAIVLTLILAIVIATVLYLIGGFLCSAGIHELWSEVPDWHPVWLPIAYPRAPFGVEYVLFLFVIPILAVAVPAWFLYESTVANLTGDNEDRSTGLKVWFSVMTPLMAVACAAPCTIVSDDKTAAALGVTGMIVFLLHATFGAYLFAFEPPGPPRRVRVHWMRDKAGLVRRFFGPGLAKSTALVAALGFFGVAFVATVAIIAVYVRHGHTSWTTQASQVVFLVAIYLAPFFVFTCGLVAWLRSRGNGPWIARLLAAAMQLLVIVGPWIVGAIGGVIAARGHDDFLVICAPSPMYLIYMLGWLDGTMAPPHANLILAGTACAIGWGLVGVLMLSAAARRSLKTVAAHDAAVEAAEAALRTEEAAERARS
jgi:ABC-type transport system involved in multi-copper enzyme maturation permease subunit